VNSQSGTTVLTSSAQWLFVAVRPALVDANCQCFAFPSTGRRRIEHNLALQEEEKELAEVSTGYSDAAA